MHDEVPVKSVNMFQKHVANVLNASINDVCEMSLIEASEELGERRTLAQFRASEESLIRLRISKLPDYSGLDPIVYSIWYHACHVAMSYKIFRTLIERACHPNTRPDPYQEIRIVDVGCGTHAGLFGLTLALARSIARRVDVPNFQFSSIDPRPDMPKFGLRLWDDFLSKAGRTSMSQPILEASKRIRLTETKCSIQELDLQSVNPPHVSQNWVLAMHVTYDETIDDLKRTLRYLNDRFSPDVGAFTSHYVNEGHLTGLYPFTTNQYVSENLIKSIEDGSEYLGHRYKERGRPSESFKDVLWQIRKPGDLHEGHNTCPSGAVIRILRRVTESLRQSVSTQPRRQYKVAIKERRHRVELSGCAVGDHKPSMMPSRENSTIGVCRSCGARHRYTRNGSTWIKGQRV